MKSKIKINVTRQKMYYVILQHTPWICSSAKKCSQNILVSRTGTNMKLNSNSNDSQFSRSLVLRPNARKYPHYIRYHFEMSEDKKL